MQTTLNALKRLESDDDGEPLVIKIRDEHNPQKYHYHANNESRVIYDLLRDIESSISIMHFPVHKLNQTKSFGDKQAKKALLAFPFQIEYIKYMNEYVGPYSGGIRTMLYYLFQKLPTMKISKKHSYIFYSKIIELMENLNEQTREIKSPKEDLVTISERFSKGKEELDIPGLITNRYFDHKIFDKLIGTFNNFVEKMLT